jgi:hypothetical protein
MLRGIVSTELQNKIVVQNPITDVVSKILIQNEYQRLLIENKKPNFYNLFDNWYKDFKVLVLDLNNNDMNSISWERKVGFLHLLEQVIKIIGFNATDYAPMFFKILTILISNANSIKEQSNIVALKPDNNKDKKVNNKKLITHNIKEKTKKDETMLEKDAFVNDVDLDAVADGVVIVDDNDDDKNPTEEGNVNELRVANQSSKVRSLGLQRVSGSFFIYF